MWLMLALERIDHGPHSLHASTPDNPCARIAAPCRLRLRKNLEDQFCVDSLDPIRRAGRTGRPLQIKRRTGSPISDESARERSRRCSALAFFAEHVHDRFMENTLPSRLEAR